jgi:hypothetical protein
MSAAAALVVDQVPLQNVELGARHTVEKRFDESRALEVARRIQHQPAPGKTRRILHVQGGDVDRALPRRRGRQLPGADRAVEQARVRGGLDGQAQRRDVEDVGLTGRRATA